MKQLLIGNHPAAVFVGIIVLEMPDDAVAAIVLMVIRSSLLQSQFLSQLAGRLAIVKSWLVRVRPPIS